MTIVPLQDTGSRTMIAATHVSIETMSSRPQNLPDFNDPPIAEVVLGLQFNPLAKFRSVHIGALWEHFRGDFPKVSEYPPLEQMFETFGTQAPRGTTLRFELVGGPIALLPRVWFTHKDDAELIQVQNDRFLHNWRRTDSGTTYPHYDQIRERYRGELDVFEKFVADNDLGKVEPNQCEVSYINHIVSQEGEDLATRLGTIFRGWSDGSAAGYEEPYEDARFVTRFTLKSKGERIGRLIVQAESGRLPDGRSLVQLTLVVRGKPERADVESAFEFLDMGRIKIVNTFTAITTEQMHGRWRRFK